MTVQRLKAIGIIIGVAAALSIALAAGLQNHSLVRVPGEIQERRERIANRAVPRALSNGSEPSPVCGLPRLDVTPFKSQPDYSDLVGIKSSQDEVGDVAVFKAYDFNKNERHDVVAKLERKGVHSYIYVDTTIALSSAALDQLFGEFDTKIYPTSTSVFGSEPKPGVDGDSLVTILVYNIRDDRFYDSSVSTFIAGYFDPNNQRRKVDFASSNEREMVYVDSEGIETRVLTTLAVLAHEFQHLIHFNQDANEETWVNEGMSEYSILLNGYPRRQPSSFLESPDDGLTAWNNELADYDQTFLFMVYLEERFGGNDLIGEITSDKRHGIPGIEGPLAARYPGLTFGEVFADWAIANYLDDTGIGDGRFGYSELQLSTPKAVVRFVGLPIQSTTGSLRAYAAEYVELQGGQDLVFHFNGNGSSPQFQVRVIKQAAGLATQIEDISLDSNNDGSAAIADYGTSFTHATFVPILQPGVGVTSAGYSYSADGSGGPTAFEDTLRYHDEASRTIIAQLGVPIILGGEHWDAYSVRFSPPSDATLLGADIAFWRRAGTGGTVRVYVNEDTASTPGAKIDSVDMDQFSGSPGTVTWNSVDFSSKNVKLQAGEDFHISWTLVNNAPGDTVWAILDTARVATDRSSVFIRERGGWFHFVDGFNFFIRAFVSVPADNSVPELTTGILQNPVFTEAADVFALSPKALNPSSVKGSIVIEGIPRTLGFRATDTENKVFADQDYLLHRSGAAMLIAEAQHKFGTVTGRDTLQFNVQMMKLQDGGQITNRDGDFDLTLPPSASNEEIYMTVMPVEADFALGDIDVGLVPDGFVPWGQAYSVGPAGYELPSGSRVRFTYKKEALESAGIDPTAVQIATLRQGGWHVLDTRVDLAAMTFSAPVRTTGAYRLLSGAVTGEEANSTTVPREFSLAQNFPNPFNPSTTIKYGLPEKSRTRLTVYNMLGQRVVTLLDREQPAGFYEIQWDGRDAAGRPMPSGLYVYRLEAGSFVSARKMARIK